MSQPREAIESPLVQGEDEELTFTVDINQWGSGPTNITVQVKDGDGSDVTATVMPTGSPSAYTETLILLPPLKDLVAGTEYRVEVRFTTDAGQVLEGFFVVVGEE